MTARKGAEPPRRVGPRGFLVFVENPGGLVLSDLGDLEQRKQEVEAVHAPHWLLAIKFEC